MMRTKIGQALLYTVAYLLIGLFFLFSLTIAALQTQRGKNYLSSYLIAKLKTQGVSVSFNNIGGLLPLEVQLDAVVVEISTTRIVADKLKVRPLYLNWLVGDFAFESVEIRNLQLYREGKLVTKWPINIEGLFGFSKDFRFYHASLEGFSPQYSEAALHVKLKGRINSLLTLDVKGKGPLSIFLEEINSPIDTLSFSLKAKGDTREFKEALLNATFPQLTVALKGEVTAKEHLLDPLLHAKVTAKGQTGAEGITIASSSIQAPILVGTLTGFVPLSSTRWPHLQFEFGTTNLKALFPIIQDGELNLQGELTTDANHQPLLKADYLAKTLTVSAINAYDLRGSFLLTVGQSALDSSFLMDAVIWDREWHLTGSSHTPYTHLSQFEIAIPNITLTSSALDSLQGTLLLGNLTEGKISGSFANLAFLEPLIPGLRSDGTTLVNLQLEKAESWQKASLEAHLTNFYYDSAHIDSAFTTISYDKTWAVTIDASKIFYRTLFLDNILFSTKLQEGEDHPYDLSFTGKLKHPLALKSRGFWHYKDKDFLITMQDLEGILEGSPFVVKEPIQFQKNEQTLLLSPLSITLPTSDIKMEVALDGDLGQAEIQLEHLPLELLSLFQNELDLSGFFSLNAFLNNSQKGLQGEITFQLEELPLLGELSTKLASGSFTGTLKDRSFQIKGALSSDKIHLIDVEATLPLEIHPFSPAIVLPNKGPFQAKVFYQGKIEQVLHLFDLGPHALGGDLYLDLNLQGSWKEPRLIGEIRLEQGSYENYYTGTVLQKIKATINAKNRYLLLDSFEASGLKGGSFEATGETVLSFRERFPFKFSILFKDLLLTQLAYAEAIGRGNLVIEGDLQGAKASGKIAIQSADVTIPSSLPISVPHLDVRFIHPLPVVQESEHPYTPLFPLELAIQVDAPKAITIRGRGVDSEWGGSFLIKGFIDEMVTRGEIELLHGSFTFMGRSLKLIEGRLTFPGVASSPPFLKLDGQTVERGRNIIATLQGPIDNPILGFRSIPPLPMSQILSLLIFGQELNEISGIQAVQLATLVTSLGGEGADILESTRSSLGIDRLNLVSVPVKDGSEALSVQVGKYITKGVLVTVTQGAGIDQSNVGVQVDLSHGFVFEAETEQQLEQGRFALKWNHSY